MLRLSQVSDGNPGIFETIEKMRALALAPSPRLDALAQRLLLAHPGASSYVRAAVVHRYLMDHLTYTQDHPDVEELTEPELLLAQVENRGSGFGDCDDYAILAAGLLLRLGVPADFIVASTRPDRIYDHVYVQAKTNLGPVPMDAIFGQPFGWSARGFTAREAISV